MREWRSASTIRPGPALRWRQSRSLEHGTKTRGLGGEKRRSHKCAHEIEKIATYRRDLAAREWRSASTIRPGPALRRRQCRSLEHSTKTQGLGGEKWRSHKRVREIAKMPTYLRDSAAQEWCYASMIRPEPALRRRRYEHLNMSKFGRDEREIR